MMWLAASKVAVPPLALSARRRVVVAVPARDEAASIASCIAALDGAARISGAPVTILVSANNCRDATVDAARSAAVSSAKVVVETVELPLALAHAGGARRHAMDRAAELAGPDGVVMTTDADSCVDPDWITANLGELAGGADAVAGMIAFDEAARAMLPKTTGREAEWRLASLHARLEHLLDPRPHDPWPRHIWAWGASLALTVTAYRAVGGLPAVPLAEDRALAEAIEHAGLRLRRSYRPLVFTSSRRAGRAPGGFADLIDTYARDDGALCDAALEPTATFVRRLTARANARAAGNLSWPKIESSMPDLARHRLRPADLTAELAYADRVIAMLEQRAARRGDSPQCAIAA